MSYEFRNTPEGEAKAKAKLGITDKANEPEVSINAQDYQVPHQYMWAMRGVPMGKYRDTVIPPINIPPECQHAFAVHLELCGFVHDPNKQVIVHLKPELGDDTPMNPGTWVRKSEVPAEDEDTVSPMSSSIEPDLSMLGEEHLDALEAAVQKAKIARKMVEQADPEAKKEAEVELSSGRPSTMPTEEELKAAMELGSETVRDRDVSAPETDKEL